MSGLKGDLASMHREHDYWCKCAEEVEKASTFSQQQTSTAFKQAHLLLMYIPLAHPEDSVEAIPMYVEELLLQLTCWVECTTRDDSGSWSRAVILYKR